MLSSESHNEKGTRTILCLDLYGNVDVEVSERNVQIWSTQATKQSFNPWVVFRLCFNFAQLRPEEKSASLSVNASGLHRGCADRILDNNAIGQETFREGQGTSLLRYYLTHVPLAQLDSEVHSLGSTFAHSSEVSWNVRKIKPSYKELLRLFFDHTNIWSVQQNKIVIITKNQALLRVLTVTRTIIATIRETTSVSNRFWQYRQRGSAKNLIF